ncbi:MAG: carbohydrate deacetylase [Candidatus Hodarchaeota archaeon]
MTMITQNHKYNYKISRQCFQNRSSQLIINADDFGITQGVNKAIIQLSEVGIVTSVSVMTNMPYYKEIYKLNENIGIGIHLNLTIGKPLLPIEIIPTIINKDGYFYNISTLISKTKNGEISKKEVEAEFNAQIESLINMGIKPDHLNTHQSLLKYPFFFKIIKKVALKNGIKGIRTYTLRKLPYNRYLNLKKILKSVYLAYQKLLWKIEGFKVTNRYDSLTDIHLNFNDAIEKLKEIFRNLQNGVLELIIHPGYLEEENSVLGKYVHEREIELHALLSRDLKKLFDYYNIELISFKDIEK